MNILPINELFETIQGEGAFTGTPAIFLRLQGCDIGCPWCDTQQTWILDLDNKKNDLQKLLDHQLQPHEWLNVKISDIIALLNNKKFHAQHVVITGGEPCMYDLTELTDEIINKTNKTIQIETSGCYDIKVNNKVWVTLSPKVNMKKKLPVLTSALNRANEIKHPVALKRHIEELEVLLKKVNNIDNTMIYLQPISTKERATSLCVQTCIEKNWKLSIQTHKYIHIE